MMMMMIEDYTIHNLSCPIRVWLDVARIRLEYS